MSLFENDHYRWRETYFVLFDIHDRPTTEMARAMLDQMGGHYEVSEIVEDEHGFFESMTLLSPDDFAAMDISYVAGEDVTASVNELYEEMKMTATDEERGKLDRIHQCNARFDVFHFEQVVEGEREEDEFLDPGTLLIVLEQLASLCNGIGIDPQSGSVM